MSSGEVYETSLPLAREDETSVTFGGVAEGVTFEEDGKEVAATTFLTFNKHVWRVAGEPKRILVAFSGDDSLYAALHPSEELAT